MEIRLRFLILALLSFFALLWQPDVARASVATLSCQSVFESGFDSETFQFRQLQHYRMFLKGHSEVVSVVYVGDEIHKGKLQLVFDESGSRRFIDRKEIADLTVVPKKSLTLQIIEKINEHSILALKLNNLMTKPLRKIAIGDGRVEIVGTLRTSPSVGEKIFKALKGFDEHMESLGFTRPQKTRVVVSDRPLLPDLTGPFSLSIPIFNIWQGTAEVPLINMAPILMKSDSVKDESILFHERTHLILAVSYERDSFVNSNATVQEALADFAAAHYLSQTEIAPGIGGNNLPLRDLKTRTASTGGNTQNRDKILDATETGYHTNSLFVSHLLWRIREKIGAVEMNVFLKQFIENSNEFYPSYRGRMQGQRVTSYDKVVHFSQDLEFIMAVLHRMALDTTDPILRNRLDDTVRDYANELGFSTERLDNFAKNFSRRAGMNNPPSKADQAKGGILIKLYGAAGFIANTSFIYWLTTLIH